MKEITNEKVEKILKFYAQAQKLKNVLRTGWVKWGFDAKRFESVAEHVYGTLMLAFSVYDGLKLNLDFNKIFIMLAFHELGETVIGDIPVVEKQHKGKEKKELDAVKEILKDFEDSLNVYGTFQKFIERKTKEAKFAYFIDKLECDLQCKYYDEKGEVDFNKKREGVYEEIRLERIKNGAKSFSEGWIDWDIQNSKYDELFKNLANYIKNHEIF